MKKDKSFALFLLIAGIFYHVLAIMHANQSVYWFWPSGMPDTFTMRQAVAEIWVVGLANRSLMLLLGGLILWKLDQKK